MKKFVFLIIFFLINFRIHAEVPHYINLQSMIYDMDGNVTTSDFVNITIRIVDSDNNVLFTETQNNIPVVEGAINLLIGGTAGLHVDMLDPLTGTKFLDVQVDGTAPFDLMPLTAVPYAMWAEKALTVADDSIESRHIKDRTIELRDLKPGIAFGDLTGEATDEQLPESLARDTELTAHILASPAHPASAISLTGPFASFVATNVQTAIEKIDMKLSDEVINRRVAGGSTNRQLADEIDARMAADALKVAKAGDTMTGSLTMQADIVMDDEGLSEEEKLKVDGVDVSTLPDLIGTNNADISDLQSRVSANDSEISDLDSRIDSNDSNIFNLQGQVSSHTTSISNLQSADNSLQSQIANLNTGLTNETNTRASADTNLQTQINNETTARSSADTNLQGQISSNDTDINNLSTNLSNETSARETADTNLQGQINSHDADIEQIQQDLQVQLSQNTDVPIGTIIPFYDFGGALSFDPVKWAYCDGRTVNIEGLGNVTLPDLSNRYLVGFGTEGGGDIDTATWDTTVAGNPNHYVNLQHSHTVNSHSHSVDPPNTTSGGSSSDNTGSESSHTHSLDSHTHDVKITSFTSGSGSAHSHEPGSLRFAVGNYTGGTDQNKILSFFNNAGSEVPLLKSTDLGGGYRYDIGTLPKFPADTSSFELWTGPPVVDWDSHSMGETNIESSHTHLIGPLNGTIDTTSGGPSPNMSGTGSTHSHTMAHNHNTDIGAFSSGGASLVTNNPEGTLDIPDWSTINIQPRSVRVRYLMRIK